MLLERHKNIHTIANLYSYMEDAIGLKGKQLWHSAAGNEFCFSD